MNVVKMPPLMVIKETIYMDNVVEENNTVRRNL